ncbi:MAG TPA: ABC transporter substrate-binding protein [bacterium]|nr:ABC transporter substrate-binding protein [bacterium]
MRIHRVITLALVLALLGSGAALGQGQKVSIIEAWFIHNESMGDPVAVEKGFFGALQVQVVGGGPGLSPIDRVMAKARAGEIVFGVDYPYNILEAREKQKLPLVVVAHDFQKSAVHLLSWKPLRSARDIQGTVATWIGYDKQIKAAIGADWAKRIKIVNQQGDPATIGAWMRKQYQFAHAMGYNEVLVAKRLVKETYYVYPIAQFGPDWPENVVFTTEAIVRQYPQIVQQFVTGHYRGLDYALKHRAEAAAILLKYNKNLDRAHELEGMDFLQSIIVTPASRANGLGYIDPAGWERMAADLVTIGVLAAPPNVRAAYTTQFKSGVKP